MLCQSTSPPGGSELPTAVLQDRYSLETTLSDYTEFLKLSEQIFENQEISPKMWIQVSSFFWKPSQRVRAEAAVSCQKGQSPQFSIPALRPGHFSQLSPGGPKRIYFCDSCSRQEHFEDFLGVFTPCKRRRNSGRKKPGRWTPFSISRW